MSGKTKFILVFSRMQPNFTEQSDANIKKKLHTCFSPIAKKSKIKTVLSIFKYRLFWNIYSIAYRRALGCRVIQAISFEKKHTNQYHSFTLE
jgi:hypothetical protein